MKTCERRFIKGLCNGFILSLLIILVMTALHLQSEGNQVRTFLGLTCVLGSIGGFFRTIFF